VTFPAHPTGSADPVDPVDPAAYGRAWAADYDRMYEGREDVSTIVSLVGQLAPGGRVLELGVGAGRLAVPLAAAGHAVTGVDASPEMLALLRRRAGAEDVQVVEGDFTAVRVEGPFDLVLVAFSTLFLVPTQSGQIATLVNCRRHLAPAGRVVVEAFVPDHSRWTRGQNLAIGRLDETGVVLKLSTHDPVRQLITTQDVTVDSDGVALRPNTLRYAWPAELDAMALASGLVLERRVADWQGRPFGAGSTAHVSVYRAVEADR
jgi:SAM-dependent methyltransferase